MNQIKPRPPRSSLYVRVTIGDTEFRDYPSIKTYLEHNTHGQIVVKVEGSYTIERQVCMGNAGIIKFIENCLESIIQDSSVEARNWKGG